MEKIHTIELSSQDVLSFEPLLIQNVARFFSWNSYSILFPSKNFSPDAIWRKEEKKIFLPLSYKDQLLGVFYARGVEVIEQSFLEQWAKLSQLIMENILFYKQSLCDPVTGLFSRYFLQQKIANSIEALKEGYYRGTDKLLFGFENEPLLSSQNNSTLVKSEALTGQKKSENTEPVYGSSGLIVIRLLNVKRIIKELGYEFADNLSSLLAQNLLASCPEQGIPARTGDMEFALYLPSATSKVCRQVSEHMLESLTKVYLEHPTRKSKVFAQLALGYSLYPENADTNAALRGSKEQSAILLRQARLAAVFASDMYTEKQAKFSNKPVIMSFSEVLKEGGKIVEILPFSRVLCNLGSNMMAKEGMHFSLWSKVSAGTELEPFFQNEYKGELVLTEVRENIAIGELITAVQDTAIEPSIGDSLHLIPDPLFSKQVSTAKNPSFEPSTGFLRHGDFLAQWIKKREKYKEFSLALLRLVPNKQEEDIESIDFSQPIAEEKIVTASSLCSEILSPELAGRFGASSFIFFHGSKTKEPLDKLYKKLCDSLEKRLNIKALVGIAHYPFMDFRKGDTLENTYKALEYASLLPAPHVGEVDSLSFNICADRLFSQGDYLGAIKEYKNALLLDEKNTMAWNSLGVCMARLGKFSEAQEYFLNALKVNTNDSMTLYNLAFIEQSQDNIQAAKRLYKQVLKEDKEHLFAYIRLGQIAEYEKKYDAARKYYAQAAELPNGEALTHRPLAKLSLAEGKEEEAREHLHEALLFDPKDAFSMSLLAQLYLDGGEDPEMALSFARQSVSLRPDYKHGWLVLAQTFEKMGNIRQSQAALYTAGRL